MSTDSARSPLNHANYYRSILSNRPHPLQKVDHLAVIVPFQRGQEICGQGQSADHWYFLVSGAARGTALSVRRHRRQRQVEIVPRPCVFTGTNWSPCGSTIVQVKRGRDLSCDLWSRRTVRTGVRERVLLCWVTVWKPRFSPSRRGYADEIDESLLNSNALQVPAALGS
jgi:hypothetical protein